MSRAYYNENNAAAAHVLRALVAEGVIALGDVDDRSIKEVQPDDLAGYTQCHFFAGDGIWSLAARLAGWPDDRPLWSGSCPCQPFSVAGKGAGEDDPRHLWPDFFRLIRARRPPVVVGEQVAGAAGYRWFDGVRADLESEGYAGRAVDIPACAVDAPHIRQRLYWCGMADADEFSARKERQQRGRELVRVGGDPQARIGNGGVALGDTLGPRLEGHAGDGYDWRQSGRLDTLAARSVAEAGGALRNGSFWSDHEWRVGADGKARRVKPGLRLLAHGVVGRVDLLRIGGNGIVCQIATEVLEALRETMP